MFEARLAQGSILKLIIDAMKDLVSDANFECSDNESPGKHFEVDNRRDEGLSVGCEL